MPPATARREPALAGFLAELLVGLDVAALPGAEDQVLALRAPAAPRQALRLYQIQRLSAARIADEGRQRNLDPLRTAASLEKGFGGPIVSQMAVDDRFDNGGDALLFPFRQLFQATPNLRTGLETHSAVFGHHSASLSFFVKMPNPCPV